MEACVEINTILLGVLLVVPVTVIQFVPLTAVHTQPVSVFTLTVSLIDPKP